MKKQNKPFWDSREGAHKSHCAVVARLTEERDIVAIVDEIHAGSPSVLSTNTRTKDWSQVAVRQQTQKLHPTHRGSNQPYRVFTTHTTCKLKSTYPLGDVSQSVQKMSLSLVALLAVLVGTIDAGLLLI